MGQPELHEDKVSSQRRRAGEGYEPPLRDDAEKRNREIEHFLVKISVNETTDTNKAGWAQLSWLKEMWVDSDKGRMQAGEMWGYEKNEAFRRTPTSGSARDLDEVHAGTSALVPDSCRRILPRSGVGGPSRVSAACGARQLGARSAGGAFAQRTWCKWRPREPVK